MPSHDRRAAGRRRAWGRGPIILRFEPLEGRQLLAASPLPDLVGSAFATSAQTLDWGDSFHVTGQVRNQGTGDETGAFNVAIYASTTPVLDAGSVLLANVPMAGNLAAGTSGSFDQVVNLPPTAIPGFSGKPIFITSRIDPGNQVAETNKTNNFGIGQGYDTASIVLAQKLPASLVGTSLGVYPDQTNWGQPVSVTAQVRNTGTGDAPPTRVQIVLTPSTVNPGNGSDVTVGYINVPAIPAFQTVNITGTITLPSAPNSVLNGNTQFYLSMIQDADFLTNPLYPHVPTQGLGLDVVQLGIAAPTTPVNTTGHRAELAAAGVIAPTQPVAWGQNLQVTTTVQNLGTADAGTFNVVFVLTGSSGAIDHAIYLGEATIPSLKAGFNQQIVQNLRLPNRLPNGITLNSVGVGKIAVLVDPEYAVDEQLKSNNVSLSNPVTLRVLGTDGSSSVPTAPSTQLGAVQVAGTLTKPKKTRAERVAARKALEKAHPRLYRQAIAKQNQTLVDKAENKIKSVPGKVKDFFHDLFN